MGLYYRYRAAEREHFSSANHNSVIPYLQAKAEGSPKGVTDPGANTPSPEAGAGKELSSDILLRVMHPERYEKG